MSGDNDQGSLFFCPDHRLPDLPDQDPFPNLPGEEASPTEPVDCLYTTVLAFAHGVRSVRTADPIILVFWTHLVLLVLRNSPSELQFVKIRFGDERNPCTGQRR